MHVVVHPAYLLENMEIFFYDSIINIIITGIFLFALLKLICKINADLHKLIYRLLHLA